MPNQYWTEIRCLIAGLLRGERAGFLVDLLAATDARSIIELRGVGSCRANVPAWPSHFKGQNTILCSR
jgi:hypothetical protein